MEWSWNRYLNNGNKRNKYKDHERKLVVCLRDRQKTSIQGTFCIKGKVLGNKVKEEQRPNYVGHSSECGFVYNWRF